MEQVKPEKDSWALYIDIYNKWDPKLKIKPKRLKIDQMDDLLDKLDLNFKEFDFRVYNTDKSFAYIYHIDDQKCAEIIVSANDQFFSYESGGSLLTKEYIRKFELRIESTLGNPFGFYYTLQIYRLAI